MTTINPGTRAFEFPEDLTEDEAFRIFWDLRRKFGWAGTFFTRGDCSEWTTDENGDYDERPLTDEEWEAVQSTYEWRKGVPDVMIDASRDVIAEAVAWAMDALSPYVPSNPEGTP